MMQVRDRLARAHGSVFGLAGEELAALPAPGQLLAVDAFPGIPADRMPRLHGVARAALDGRLDAGRLLDLGPEQAMTELQALDGIGPFYSSLIVVRGTGVHRRAPGPRAPGAGPGRPVVPAGRAPDRSRVPRPGRVLDAVPHLGGGAHPGRHGAGTGRGRSGAGGASAGVR